MGLGLDSLVLNEWVALVKGLLTHMWSNPHSPLTLFAQSVPQFSWLDQEPAYLKLCLSWLKLWDPPSSFLSPLLGQSSHLLPSSPKVSFQLQLSWFDHSQGVDALDLNSPGSLDSHCLAPLPRSQDWRALQSYLISITQVFEVNFIIIYIHFMDGENKEQRG